MSPRLLSWLVPLAAAACAHPVPPPAPEAARSGHLVLVHTNDSHAHYGPTAAPWLPGEPAIGGFEPLSAFLETVRASVPDGQILVLDAGDVLSGTPLSELEVDGVRGGEVLGFLADLGYDAQALGNHEFDQGWDGVARFVAASRVPILCANLLAPTGGPAIPGLLPARIIEVGGLRVGVIGVITDELQRLVAASTWERLRYLDPVDAVTAQAERLDPETDLLVVLSHAGLETDRRLAAVVPAIDLVVGGHSHDALKTPERVGDVYVVQAGSYTRSAGRLEIDVADDAIVALQGSLVDLVPQPDWRPASPAVVERVRRVSAELDARFGRVVGTLPGPLKGESYLQGALGVWVSSILRAHCGADVGVYNPGGLRGDLPGGEVTYAALYEVLPFGNEAATFTMTGAELLRMVERAAFAEQTQKTTAPQLAGVAWTWRPGPDQPILGPVTVGGAPLDLARTYVVVSNNYVGEHIDESYGLPERTLQSTGASVIDLVESALRAGSMEPPPTRSMRAP